MPDVAREVHEAISLHNLESDLLLKLVGKSKLFLFSKEQNAYGTFVLKFFTKYISFCLIMSGESSGHVIST